ncbi:MAG TPA: hypothetical protein VH764_04045 [Gemmatimonadales bacterium]
MEIVQQPFAGGADVVAAPLGRRQPVVRVGEDAAGLIEAVQEAVAGAGRTLDEPLRLGQRSRPLGQTLAAEQLAPDRAGEELVEPRTGAALEAAGDGGRDREGKNVDARLRTVRQEGTDRR